MVAAILCQRAERSSREGSKVSRGWLCSSTVEQEQCGSDAGSALQVERATHDTGSDFVKAGKQQRRCGSLHDGQQEPVADDNNNSNNMTDYQRPVVLTNTDNSCWKKNPPHFALNNLYHLAAV